MNNLIRPDWQPVETIPKDGSLVRLAIQWVEFHKGKLHNQHVDVFWGKMSGYPDESEVWVSVENPDNGLYCEEEFVREIFNYESKYGKKTDYGWRGSRIVGWTRPWEIEYPKLPDPVYRDYQHATIKD